MLALLDHRSSRPARPPKGWRVDHVALTARSCNAVSADLESSAQSGDGLGAVRATGPMTGLAVFALRAPATIGSHRIGLLTVGLNAGALGAHTDRRLTLRKGPY